MHVYSHLPIWHLKETLWSIDKELNFYFFLTGSLILAIEHLILILINSAIGCFFYYENLSKTFCYHIMRERE